MLNRCIAALSAALAIFALPCKTVRAADQVTLQLRSEHQFEFAGYYAALWQGFFADRGLEVELKPGITADGRMLRPVDEVAAGRAVFGIGSADVLRANDRGAALMVLASIFQTSGAALFARTDTRLERPADLLDLRVARSLGDPIDTEMQAMLLQEGIDPLRIAAHPRRPGWEDLFSGKVDVLPGYTLSAGYAAQRAGSWLRTLRLRSYGIDFYGDSLFARQDLIVRDPELARRFLDASLHGWRYALENKHEVATRIARELPRIAKIADPLAFNLHQAREVETLIDYPRVPLGATNAERWQRMQEMMHRLGLVRSLRSADDLVFDPGRLAALREARLWRLTLLLGSALFVVVLLGVAWSRSLRRAVNRATAALQASEQRFRDIAEVASDWFWELDAQLRYTYISPNFETIMNVPRASLLRRRWEDQRLPRAGGTDWQQHVRDLAARRPFRGVLYAMLDRRGNVRWCEIAGKPLYNEHGIFRGYRGVGRDVTRRVEAAARLQHAAYRDALSGLPNRAMLGMRLAAALGLAQAGGTHVGVFLLDLDGFKRVNDTHGHGAGDRVIESWARRLRSTVREADCVARLGGDEFAIIMVVGSDVRASLAAVAERLVKAAAEPFIIGDLHIQLGVSIGIACGPQHGERGEQLLHHADVALYRAKAMGRGTYAFFDSQMILEGVAEATVTKPRPLVGSVDRLTPIAVGMPGSAARKISGY